MVFTATNRTYPSIANNIIEDSDIILEILDARFIQDTRNKELEQKIKNKDKQIIFVINKSDIANTDKEIVKELDPYVLTSCTKRKGIRELRNKIKITAKKVYRPVDPSGKISVGVIGYPNTGKSSLINLLTGKHVAGTGADAGFTKGVQKLRLTPEIMLLDSPGIIPDKQYSSIRKDLIATHTKLSARSYSQVKDPEMVIASLMKEFPEVLDKHYKINAKENSEILIEELGKKKNLLKKAGEVDSDKVSRLILKDWQTGKIRV